MSKVPSFIDEKDNDIEDSLAELQGLVGAYKAYDELVKQCEEDLKKAKDAFNRVAQEEIPNLLLAKGLSSIKLDTGEKIDVRDSLNVTITDEQAFVDWLKEREEDDIVKTMISLDRMPSGMLKRLYSFLNDNTYPYESKTGVHHKTKEAYFKSLTGTDHRISEQERIEGYASGRYIPISNLPEWVSVYVIHKAKIK